jgi:hypothetical protein
MLRSARVRSYLYAVTAISCSSTAAPPIRGEAHPVDPKSVQVSRDILIDLDQNASFRETFHLETNGVRARLTITRERNAVARLDAWTLPWTVESTEVFIGTVARSGSRTDYDLANGTRRVELSCSPRTYNDVLSATARLLASAGDCRDPRGRWEPSTTETVSGIGCTRIESTGTPADAPPLDFTAAPGIEWVDERNGCVAQGQGYRRMPQ